MKIKIQIRFLSFLLMILFFCAFVGCSAQNATSTVSSKTKTDANASAGGSAEGEEELLVNGVPISEYTVIYSRADDGISQKGVTYFSKTLYDSYGFFLAKSTVSCGGYEIIIGTGTDEASVSTAFQKSGGGYIGVKSGRIYLLGVNEYALRQVIDSFFARRSGCEIDLFAGTAVALKKTEICALSYNVQEQLDKAGRPADSIAKMIATIRSESPDVFGTQEDTDEISNGFTSGMSEYSCYRGAQYYESRSSGDRVYWKTDKFNVIDKGYRFMSDTPTKRSKYEDSSAYRGFTYVFLESKETGIRFLFLNLHTDYSGPESVRVKQLKVLTDFLQVYHESKIPVVILGDFNAKPTWDSIKTFLTDNPRIASTMSVAETKGDVSGTLVVSEFSERERKYVFDYIFVTKDKIFTKYYSAIDNVKNGKYPSDHLPVVARMDIY